MSTKSTIFLTDDNEHCYTDSTDPVTKDGEYIGDTITMELAQKNIRLAHMDFDVMVLEIDPGSELYELIKRMYR